ncbi:UPF0462 protein C4orf33 homolog isoform X2 [Littorina saxatilis]|uniref:UPF0462 protein C4orf33 homolog isoform X2 n=1 Tax=Littorina saxatilis TaxID=31220 RepID=UPI0038B64F13
MQMSRHGRDFDIQTTWDKKAVTHEPVRVHLAEDQSGCRLEVHAPFFGSPPAPAAPSGQPCPQLWDYEVVEAFFMNDKHQYVEVELCPHGQHLVLILNGRRNIVQEQLPLLEFKAEISGNRWHGSAVVPASYLPPSVTKFNAFAIHGEGEDRVYEALYPATQHHDTPDFHRLEYFGDIDMSRVSPSLVTATPSDLWNKYPPPSS